MAYGFEIQTTVGKINAFDASSLQLAELLHVTSATGSATITSKFDSDRGGYISKIVAGRYMPALTFNNTTKLFTWTRWATNQYPAALVSDDFYVLFYHKD